MPKIELDTPMPVALPFERTGQITINQIWAQQLSASALPLPAAVPYVAYGEICDTEGEALFCHGDTPELAWKLMRDALAQRACEDHANERALLNNVPVSDGAWTGSVMSRISRKLSPR